MSLDEWGLICPDPRNDRLEPFDQLLHSGITDNPFYNSKKFSWQLQRARKFGAIFLLFLSSG
jgi:hypothetical protein